MPDENTDTFAKLFAKGEVIIGGKYGDGNNTKQQPPRPKNPKPNSDSRPKYDGGAKYLANGVDERMLRKLRRGEPEDAVDLHGMTIDDATCALAEFVVDAQSRGYRNIEVIHGKGANILKPMARKWLAECCEVLAFCEVGGNGGAVRVLLRA